MNNEEVNKFRVKALRYGDEDTFKELYLEYYSKLIAIGRRFNFSFLTPEDFVQETFLKLHKNREKLNDTILLDKQIYVICKNIILNHLKKEKKNVSFDLSESLAVLQPDNTIDIPEDSLQKKQLFQLIGQLPEKRKEVFTLHKIEQYTYEEIAEITNLSKKTIANHIYLANQYILKNFKKISF